MNGKLAFVLIISAMLMVTPTMGYSKGSTDTAAAYQTHAAVVNIPPITVPRSQSSEIFPIQTSDATGKNAIKNHAAEIDISNAKNGYVMVRYLAKTNKALKVVIKTPKGTTYIYGLRADGKYETFPFSEGNGNYQITVYENAFSNKYFAVIETAQNIQLTDKFAPFIRPNQYVNYDVNSKTTQKAAELTKGAKTIIDKIAAIYNYVIKNISYDLQLSNTIQAGYIPDVDKVLTSGKGICFDYAAVMTAMLRSQGIPTKLVVGYRGTDYHAWISTYSNETGWVDGAVYFNNKKWKLMDPTLDALGGKNSNAWQYIGNEKNYSAKYFY